MFAASFTGKAAINTNFSQPSGLLSAQTNTQQEYLSWKPVEFENNEPEKTKDEPIAVAMNQYIVIFAKSKDGSNQQSNPVIFDTENRVCHEVHISPDPILQFKTSFASYWKDNKIIVAHHRDVGGTRLDVKIGIVTISFPSAEDQEFKAEYQKIEYSLGRNTGTIQSYTMHLQNDRLYIIARCYLGGYAYNLFYLDMETLKLIQVQELLSIRPIEKHTSYFYQNKIYVYFKGTPEALASNNEEICIHTDKETKIEETRSSFHVEKRQNLEFSPINYHEFQYQVSNGKLYGFQQEEYFGAMHVYDIETRVWEKLNILATNPTKKGIIILLDNQIYLFRSHENQFWCLSLGPNTKFKAPEDLVKPQFKSESPSNLSSLLKLFLNQAPQHDVTFEVESELISAHKWWLTQKSKYFANMFSSGMLEAQSQKISISDMKATTFKAFLEFLYSDHIDLDENLALDLIQQADKYSVPDLKKLCEQCLSVCLSSENYVKIAQLAELLDANLLREATVAYIAKNVKKLKERSDFQEISDNLLRDVIIKITVK